MTFRPDSSRSSRAHHAEERARRLVQDVLDREERVRNNLASPEVNPWEMRFIVDESITDGAIALWRHEATRAKRLLRRFDIQSGYREKIRDVEKRIDAMLHLSENLEEMWDAAAVASKKLSDAEATDAVAFEKERKRQSTVAAQKKMKEEKRREFRRKAEHLATDALDRTKEASGEVLRRSLEAGKEALDKLPPIRDWSSIFGGSERDDAPREVRKATARDLRKEPPLPED